MILRPCSIPGCPELTEGGPCESHRRARQREHDVRRGKAAERGYDARWRRLRLVFLREHPLCADPFGDHEGRATPAECVDHIIAHKGDMELFWDESNWQPLCLHCNSKKAATSEGRWGFARAWF
jgi:5-methylcytosine-specific restriction protein A